MILSSNSPISKTKTKNLQKQRSHKLSEINFLSENLE